LRSLATDFILTRGLYSFIGSRIWRVASRRDALRCVTARRYTNDTKAFNAKHSCRVYRNKIIFRQNFLIKYAKCSGYSVKGCKLILRVFSLFCAQVRARSWLSPRTDNFIRWTSNFRRVYRWKNVITENCGIIICNTLLTFNWLLILQNYSENLLLLSIPIIN